MPYNNKSLQNLSRTGSKPGKRKQITNTVVKQMTGYLDHSFEYFLAQMKTLTPKEYVDAYLKLIKLVLPTKLIADVEPMEKPVFIIQLATEQPEDNQ